mmetsp:Transcript_4742/g.17706  ORF Transcript_4742/g.17706 Transcript_4742/m.17706 type:complete len:202 (+) Transcript_4742:545-1150(+)
MLRVFLEHVEAPPDDLHHLLLRGQVLQFVLAGGGDPQAEPAVALVDEVLHERSGSPRDQRRVRGGVAHLGRRALDGAYGEAVRCDVLHGLVDELLAHDARELVVLGLAPAHALGRAIRIFFHAWFLRPVGTLPSEYSLRVSREAPRDREVRSVREGAAHGLDMSRRDHVERGRGPRGTDRGSKGARRARSEDHHHLFLPNT